MPRRLQGDGNKGGKSGKGSRPGGDDDNASALQTKCMGEEGRDYLRRFVSDSTFAKQVMQSIDEDGYCVLPGILSQAEADAELDRAWGFIERVSPSVKRSDRNTWWGNGGPDPWPHAQRDMMQLHHAGWLFTDLREKFAERVFEKLYGTKELHVSKDGFTFQRPTNGDLHRTPNDHFDQGLRWKGLQCIQGSIALTDQSENDGCFKVWPGSHVHREEILSGYAYQKARDTDFIIMKSHEHELLQERGIQPKRVTVKRGDAILWRSDVAHCGAPPIGRCDSYRAVAYICCLPAALTPEAVYEQKNRAYLRLETGCHYPNREEWFEVSEKHSKIDWRPYFMEPPELSFRQRQLYGLERYNASATIEVGESGSGVASASLQNSTSTVIAGPVSGLDLWHAPQSAVRAALAELRPHFRSGHTKSSSDMIEVGWSFHAMEQQKVMRIANPLTDFPSLQALIAEIVQVFCPHDASLGEETINIICRRYTRGQSLPKHLDRPQLFDEHVYGCVLHNTSDKALFFEQQARSGDRTAGPHILEEKPGLCFRTQGPSRYEWIHGVDELTHGERISITWRWIQEDAAKEGREHAQTRRSKGDSKGKGKGNGKSKRPRNEDQASQPPQAEAGVDSKTVRSQSAVAEVRPSTELQVSKAAQPEAGAAEAPPSSGSQASTTNAESRRNRWGRKDRS